MIVSIHQPNFMPWYGLIHKIYKSDVFVVFDDVQFPVGKSHFGHRTRIRTNSPDGYQYLTIPTHNRSAMLNWGDIKINNETPWKEKHRNILYNAYHKSPNFKKVMSIIDEGYATDSEYIVPYNMWFIHKILELVEYNGKVIYSSTLNVNEANTTKKIIGIVASVGGDKYLSGTGTGSARYVDNQSFEESGIELMYDIFHHPIYPQQFSPFIENLSILDMLYNIDINEIISFLKNE